MLPTGRYWHIIQLCSKDVLTGSSQCGRARSAANVRVRQASRQMRTLRSCWRQKRPTLVELLTGWLQEKKLIISLSSLLMDKKIVTEAKLLDAAVEHIHKFSVGRLDLAHWLNHGPDTDRDCLDHTIPGCTLLREWSKISKPRTHLYASTCLYAAGQKEGE